MRAPLSVRVSDGYTDRHVTKWVTGLKFRKTAPGGFAYAECQLVLPKNSFNDLGPTDRLWIYAPSGRVVWDGYTNNPGTQTGRTGEGYALTALGGVALASDRSEQLIYLDRTYEGWRRGDNSVTGVAPSATCEISAFPEGATAARTDVPCLYNQFTPGQPITTTSRAVQLYDAFENTPMTLGAIAGWYDAGITSVDYAVRMTCQPFVTGDARPLDVTASTVGAAVTAYAGTDFPINKTGLSWIMQRLNTATNVATDVVWVGFSDVALFGHFFDRNGFQRTMSTVAHITPATSTTFAQAYVLASDVAEDLLGRLLTMCDPVRSVIDTTTYPIDQLAYRDAVRSAQVLDDLSLYEPDYLWEILESNAVGQHRFNYRAWPTAPRYLLPPSIKVEQPGGDVDLCNRIAVNWTDENGNPQVTVVISVLAQLGPRLRDSEPVTLPEGQGSLANAQRLGAQILAAKATPPRAGTATVDLPILDLLTGALVQPWEIEPGYLVRVMATGEDIRLTEVEYTDDTCSATLTIGDPVLTMEQRVAQLQRAAPASPR